MANIFGNGLVGRIEVNYDSTWVGGGGTSNTGNNWAALLANWHITRNDTRYYYVKDHLGSIRQTWKENGAIVNGQDYYPFGEVLRQYTVSNPIEKYMFTEKERDKETGYDYFGARYYDPQIGRWLSVDPLAHNYPSLSPYNYVANNPLIFIDPDGMGIYDMKGKQINASKAFGLIVDGIKSLYADNFKESYRNFVQKYEIGDMFEAGWSRISTPMGRGIISFDQEVIGDLESVEVNTLVPDEMDKINFSPATEGSENIAMRVYNLRGDQLIKIVGSKNQINKFLKQKFGKDQISGVKYGRKREELMKASGLDIEEFKKYQQKKRKRKKDDEERWKEYDVENSGD